MVLHCGAGVRRVQGEFGVLTRRYSLVFPLWLWFRPLLVSSGAALIFSCASCVSLQVVCQSPVLPFFANLGAGQERSTRHPGLPNDPDAHHSLAQQQQGERPRNVTVQRLLM